MAYKSRTFAWSVVACFLLHYVSATKAVTKIRLEDIEDDNNRVSQAAKNAAAAAAAKQPVIQQEGGFIPQQYYFQPQGVPSYQPQVQGAAPQPQFYLGQREQIALLEALGQQQAQFGGAPFAHGLYGSPQGQGIPVQYSIGVLGQGAQGIPSAVAQPSYSLPAAPALPPQHGAGAVKIPVATTPAPQIQYHQQVQVQPALEKSPAPQNVLQNFQQQQFQQQFLAQSLQPQHQQAAQAVAQAQLQPKQPQRVYPAAQVAQQGPQYSPQQQFYQIPQYLQQINPQPQYTQQVVQQARIPQQYLGQQQPLQFAHQLPQQPQYIPQISPEQLQQLFLQQYPQHAAQAQALQENPKTVQIQQAQKVAQRRPAIQRYVPEPKQQLASSEPFKPSRPIFQQPFLYPEVEAPQRLALQGQPEGGQVIYGFGGVENQFDSGKLSAVDLKRVRVRGSRFPVRGQAGPAYTKGSYTPS